MPDYLVVNAPPLYIYCISNSAMCGLGKIDVIVLIVVIFIINLCSSSL